MAVEANPNLLPQEISDFIPLGMENCRDFISTKPRLPGFQSIFPFTRSRPAKSPMNVAGNNPLQQSLHRKRSRDSLDLYNPSPVFASAKNPQISAAGDEILQSEIDRIVSHHTKKLRMEFEERQKQTARSLMAAIGEGLMKKLREKDEEIQRIGKLNFALQERVKSLYVENQLWRDMAQTNEAAANSLRSNLEQVLAAAAAADERVSCPAAAVEEDAESCCGSSDHGRAGPEVCTAAMPEWRTPPPTDAQDSNGGGGGRMCRRCGERESSVLLLPCRHLCLCHVCGSTLIRSCPVCNSNMNATVHVNLSS